MIYIFGDYIFVFGYLFLISLSIYLGHTDGHVHTTLCVCLSVLFFLYVLYEVCLCPCVVYIEVCHSICMFTFVSLCVSVSAYRCVPVHVRKPRTNPTAWKTLLSWPSGSQIRYCVRVPFYLAPASPMLRPTALVPEQGLTTPDSLDYYTSLSLPKTREVKLFIPVFSVWNSDSVWRLKRLRCGREREVLCWAGNGDVDLFRYGCTLRFLGSGR